MRGAGCVGYPLAVPIDRIELRDFTVFRETRIDLAAGVNVFIGRNSTGKTHAMKALYGFLRAANASPAKAFNAEVAYQLVQLFRPDDDALGRLGQRRKGQKTFKITVARGKHELSAQVYSGDGRVQTRTSLGDPPSAVFIPAAEALAMHEGFTRVWEQRWLQFDSNYYDLARELSTPPLRGSRPGMLGSVVARLQDTLGGRLETRGERFYLVAPGGARYEAPLLSEGLRKIGTFLRLLSNGEINAETVLLWDEPETNLNPHLVVAVADMLSDLARDGLQIIVATHDYFLSETLALRSREPGARPARFFSFVRSEDGASVNVIGEDDIDALPENAIRAESLAHYDRLHRTAP